MAQRVVYAREQDLAAEEFGAVLDASGMGNIRPVKDPARLRELLAGANLVVTARLDTPGRPLVGVARGLSDGAWCCYLSEVAVAPSAQRLGVGRGLLEETRRQLGPRVAVILASVPEACGFYERIGMERIDHAFWFRRGQ
jgi:ribosomal protein S18 acetylase RimI-like enzyme